MNNWVLNVAQMDVTIVFHATKNCRWGKQTAEAAIFWHTSAIFYQGVSDPCHQLTVKSSLETNRIPAILAQQRAQPEMPSR